MFELAIADDRARQLRKEARLAGGTCRLDRRLDGHGARSRRSARRVATTDRSH